MMQCVSCGAVAASQNGKCSNCGAEITPPGDETVVIPAAPPPSVTPRSGSGVSRLSLTSTTEDEGRFLPGTLVAGRYRIIGLLGRGGMGEVYRATDLTLAQSVALKFLPDEAAGNERLLERFHSEVRIARQVSHPNVCRVYDIGEAEGLPFISMEYVDGEDLASLLQRIGRLPSDKALEIARKLCAGLAAAHERSVIHRDLKPHNVMLNKRGGVVIMDFGLAAIADQLEGAEARSGTPAYMAPEQLRGDSVTAKSDIFSLGLIVYELFTGKRAFDADSVAELLRAEETQRPPSISSLAADVDPAVEKVILRCLHPDPAQRPPNALAVAAALPGGDPLAAALAAGETPSPELVAASGATKGFALRYAVPCLVFCLLGTMAYPILMKPLSMLATAPAEFPPAVMENKAREISAAVGYSAKPTDWISGIGTNYELLNYFTEHSREGRSWQQIFAVESPLYFYYRQSPRYLLAPPDGEPGSERPPIDLPGMTGSILDSRGFLREFRGVAPRDEGASTIPPGAFDPAVAFRFAGLDLAKFHEVAPAYVPPIAFDTRHAWSGPHPGLPNVSITVELASWRNQLTSFTIRWPWTEPVSTKPQTWSFGSLPSIALRLTALFCVFFFAIRNLRSGRGNRAGALRLAGVSFLILVINYFAGAHMAPVPDVLGYAFQQLSFFLAFCFLIWLGYLALEPAVRARWPHSLITWNRLLAGQFGDPQVGSHILIGVVIGVSLRYLFFWRLKVLMAGGAPPDTSDYGAIESVREAIKSLTMTGFGAIQSGLIIFFLLCGLRALLRRDYLAALAAALILTLVGNVRNSDHLLVDLVVFIGIYTLFCFLLLRMGLIPTFVGIFVTNVFGMVPVGSEFLGWYNPYAVAILGLVAAITIYGFWRSQATVSKSIAYRAGSARSSG